MFSDDAHQLLDKFEEEWITGNAPKAEDFLNLYQGSDSDKVFEELVSIEFYWRKKSENHASTDELLERRKATSEKLQLLSRSVDKSSILDSTIRSDIVRTPISNIVSSSGENTQGKSIGPYVLERHLGHGSFANVWLGRRPGQLATTQVAIKIPNDSDRISQLIHKEAKTWARASGHPNVVPIIDADIFNNVVAIVSEYIEGGSLRELLVRSLASSENLAIDKSVELVIGVLSGLEYLHSREIVHRDIKPENILLQQGIPRLTDFGLSVSGVNNRAEIAGTPRYMPPEAFYGSTSVSSDIWSVGVLLIELLTGSVPFTGSTLSELMGKIEKEIDLSVTEEIPEELKSIIGRALEIKPERRFRSATEMKAALSDYRRHSNYPNDFEHRRHFTISITGSMFGDANALRNRLARAVSSYCSPLTTWYIGSNGIVDEHSIETLAGFKQQMFLVGYFEKDTSSVVRHFVDDYDLPFIDASMEDIPENDDAPSKRDIFFATKSDLVILFWNGESEGTERLRRWLHKSKRDYQLIHF